jgi:hypothetical protein
MKANAGAVKAQPGAVEEAQHRAMKAYPLAMEALLEAVKTHPGARDACHRRGKGVTFCKIIV